MSSGPRLPSLSPPRPPRPVRAWRRRARRWPRDGDAHRARVCDGTDARWQGWTARGRASGSAVSPILHLHLHPRGSVAPPSSPSAHASIRVSASPRARPFRSVPPACTSLASGPRAPRPAPRPQARTQRASTAPPRTFRLLELSMWPRILKKHGRDLENMAAILENMAAVHVKRSRLLHRPAAHACVPRQTEANHNL